MAAGYDAAAPAWSAGPETVYTALAVGMWRAAEVGLRGARVLDLGAGTGAAGLAALDAGAAEVVAVDLAAAMLRRCGPRIRPVIADVRRLPFRPGTFEVACAACCLGHLPDPVEALHELHRLDAVVVASAFPLGWTHPAKGAVDEQLGRLGYQPPAWYPDFKARTEPGVGDPDRLAGLARDAGLATVTVRQIVVETGVRTPELLVDWRLGMAHIAPFVATLGPGERDALHCAAAAELRGAPSLDIPLLVLTAR